MVEFNGANATDSFNFKSKKNWSDGDNGTKELEKMVPLNYL